VAKKKRRRRSKRGRNAAAGTIRRVRFELSQLEIARGHDGFMRGKPEPVLLAGLYACVDAEATLVARGVFDFERPGPYPAVVTCPGDALTARLRLGAGRGLLLLLLAFERDGGADVARVYALLDEPERLQLWSEADAEPAPHALSETRATEATRVNLLLEREPLPKLMKDDDWIGAVAMWTESSRVDLSPRARFLSRDEMNDWTATFSLRAR